MSNSNSDDNIAVASSLYNLAGPETGRVDFLKSLIIAALQNGSDVSSALNQGYMTGPGVRYRQFSNWSQNNTDFTNTFGITSGAVMAAPSIDPLTLQTAMNAVPVCASPQQVDSIQSADILGAEIQYWVLQYMYANYSVGTGMGQQPVPYPAVPGQSSGASTYSYDSVHNLVTITLADGTTLVTFTPSGYDPVTANLNYLYVKYNPAVPASSASQVYGPQLTLASTDPDPTYPNPPYLQYPGAESTGTYSASLTTNSVCVTTFSDGRPSVTNTATPVVQTEVQPTYYNMWAYDQAPNSGTPSAVPFNNVGQPATISGAEYTIRFYFEYWVQWVIATQVNTYTNSGALAGFPGVTYTNTITETAQVLQKVRMTRASSQNMLWTTILPPQYWIYKYGSGNSTVDTLMTPPTPTSLGAFYPPIPFISAKQAVGPLQNTATQWSIEIPWPGFDPATNYYSYQDPSGRDIQVSDTPGAADADWVSLGSISDNTSAGANHYYCQTLPKSQILPSNSIAGEEGGWGPLCTVFADTTAANPGYFRVRKWVTYTAWTTGTYVVGDIVQKSSHTYQATTVTGPDTGSGPTGTNMHATSVSGGVTWTCIADGTDGWMVVTSGVGSVPTLLLSAPVPDPVGSDYNPLMGTIYPVAKQAFQRAYGGQSDSYDTVQQQILQNADLTNIDYVYAVFGVALNVQEPACRKYIYLFLKNLLTQQGSNGAAWQTFMSQYTAANDSWLVWQSWYTTYHNTDGTPKTGPWTDSSGQQITSPPPEPTRLPYPSIPLLMCQVQSVHAGVTNYRMDLRYGLIEEIFGTGVLQKPTYYPMTDTTSGQNPGYPVFDMSGNPVTTAANEGDIWWTVEPDSIDTYSTQISTQIGETLQITPDEYKLLDNNKLSLYWQYDANNWKRLVITGLVYENWIYETYKIWYSAAESVNWTQPNPDGTHAANAAVAESPFLFPMHSSIYASMTMVDSTQMATACTFLMFNCWQKVVLPWYEQTWFQVVVVVIVVIIAIVAAYFSGGTSLGAAGAGLDAFLGLDEVADLGVEAALLAAVIGAIADVAVGLTLSYIASFLLQQLFPGEAGAIIGAIIGLALALYAGGATSVSSIESMLSTASGWISFSADLLIAAGKIATAVIDNSILLMSQQSSAEVGATESETTNIENLIASTFGDSEIDPTLAAQYLLVEPPATFLTRTLMVGSDIVQATLDQVSEYADVHLQLPLPGIDPEDGS